jgi:Family of unknown function (DUF6516)
MEYMDEAPEHTLEFLLAFDGRMHWYAEGYFVKFEIKRVEPSKERPHGLRYSLTLHGPGGMRLIGFDNAHGVASAGSRYNKRQVAADHWHRTESDPGRPYRFRDAATLIDDFFNEVERVLSGLGISVRVIHTDDERSKT